MYTAFARDRVQKHYKKCFVDVSSSTSPPVIVKHRHFTGGSGGASKITIAGSYSGSAVGNGYSAVQFNGRGHKVELGS